VSERERESRVRRDVTIRVCVCGWVGGGGACVCVCVSVWCVVCVAGESRLTRVSFLFLLAGEFGQFSVTHP
jgi:hypothetical protein